MLSDSHACRSLLRVVHVGIVISLVWKVRFYWYSLGVIDEFPLVDSFFPELFRAKGSLVGAWCLAVGCSILSLVFRQKNILVGLGAIGFFALSLLCVHQNSYNDVTFLCCAWCSLWCLWFTSRLGEEFDTLYPRAAWLSHLILSLIFLGAAIGKMTLGYWSGDVLHEIYFTGRDFWTYNLLRESLSEEALRDAATWHSKMVVVSEFICAFLWVMPRKIASFVAIVVLGGIALTNNTALFSVVSCLIALAIVGLHDQKKIASPAE